MSSTVTGSDRADCPGCGALLGIFYGEDLVMKHRGEEAGINWRFCPRCKTRRLKTEMVRRRGNAEGRFLMAS